MKIEDMVEFFDFENNHYYYHITGKGVGDLICEEGLLVDGTNILDAKNLKDTTTIEITPDMLESFDDFIDFVDGEVNSIVARDTSEMVILSSPKKKHKNIVSSYRNFKEDNYFDGIIRSNYVMGYINQDLEFTPNVNFEFGNDAFYDSLYEAGKSY